ncbi:hypothetical protein PFTANZ_06022, partial [Plasmodium falciparum Tanzania (2000708)]
MVPQSRSGGGKDDYKNAKDAKHLFDIIGKDVHDQVKKDANELKNDLKGNLTSSTSTSLELVSTDKTCTLVEDYYNERADANGERYPCGNRTGKEERFSDTLGGQCTDHRIKGNDRNKTGGACAPYRRLHLCDYNLESIDTTSTTTTSDTLLLEVCMAAKYEGNSIYTHYTQHKRTNEDSASQLCTVLARSFADIGDIVRGKDLYLGYDQKEKDQRKQLDDKLKDIFAKIHSEVTKGRSASPLQARYKKDDKDPYYYKLREDWWNCTEDGVAGQDTTIDKLLNQEDKDATECKETHKDDCNKPQQSAGGASGGAPDKPPAGRSQPPDSASKDDDEEDEEEEDEDEDHGHDGDGGADETAKESATEEEEKETEASEADGDGTEVTAVENPDTTVDGESGPKVDKVKPPCKIVETLFNDTSQFKDVACKQKYSAPNRYWGWKCIPSGDKTGTGERAGRVARSAEGATGSSGDTTGGSICVPPRRRRLYVTPLTKWVENTQVTQPQASDVSPGNGDDPKVELLKAFVESAAVETFFLWDRYKKENTKTQSGSQLLGISSTLENSDEDPQSPQNQLASGTIPPDFLRQMFYTLGDYRDILVRGGGKNTNISGSSDKDSGSKDNTNNDKTNIVLLASENKQDMDKIQEKIQQILSQNGDTPHPKTSVTTPQTLWGDFAQYIWNGMICALTYEEKTSSASGGDKTTTINQDSGLKDKLWDEKNNKPKNDYQYSSVTLKDENSGAQPNQTAPAPSENTPTLLTQFVLRPTYFRYLDEW